MLTVAELAEYAPLAASDYYLHGEITEMAMGLDAAMAKRGFRGWLARRRYRKIWGVSWRPLVLAAIDSLDHPPQLAAGTARYARALTDTVR